MAAVNLSHIVEEERNNCDCERKWNQSTLWRLLWREVVGDLVKQFVVVSHSRVGRFIRSLVKVHVEDTQVKAEWLKSPWIVDMAHHLVVAINQVLDQIAQVEINLVALDRLNVVSMSCVWNLIIFLKSHIEGLRILCLFFVTEKLGI